MLHRTRRALSAAGTLALVAVATFVLVPAADRARRVRWSIEFSFRRDAERI